MSGEAKQNYELELQVVPTATLCRKLEFIFLWAGELSRLTAWSFVESLQYIIRQTGLPVVLRKKEGESRAEGG